MAVIAKYASRIGMSSAADAALDGLDAAQRLAILLNNLRFAVIGSDLHSIQLALNAVGPSGVLSRVPDFFPLFIMYYKLPTGTVANPSYNLNANALTVGSPVVTFTSGSFSNNDVGSPFSIPQAGTSGATLTGTIAAVNSSTSITLSSNIATLPVGTVNFSYGGNNYAACFNDVMNIFNQVDPTGTWYQYERNGVWIPDLTVFQQASNDSKTIFSVDSTFGPIVLIAGNYPSTDIVKLAQKQYPKALIK